MNKKYLLAISAASLITSSAMANDLAAGLTAGTMGIGVSATTSLIENVNLRANISTYEYKKSGNSGGDIDYDMKLKLFGMGLLADYHPFAGDFRLSLGAYYNGNKFTMDGKPRGGSYTINGTTYTAAQVGSANAEVKYNKIAPYVGLGWGNAIDKSGNFKFSVDAGAMYVGSAKTSLSVSNPANAVSQADIDSESSKLQNNANKLKWWPLIALSLTYRF
jgi:hypothetical protein